MECAGDGVLVPSWLAVDAPLPPVRLAHEIAGASNPHGRIAMVVLAWIGIGTALHFIA